MNNKLPIKYIPLSHSNLEENLEFGPVEFSVRQKSHNKSKKLLEESDVYHQTKIVTPYLFPSEIWGWARVFSHYFGRLNEVAVSRARWEIHGTALPSKNLIAKSKVVNIKIRNNLPFATAETITEDENGTLLMRSVDELLLLHDVHDPFYQERAKETIHSKKFMYNRTRRVYFRYDWNNSEWLNNIHTDQYAQQFGYEKGLPEFIMYMDWIFLTQLEQLGKKAYKKTTIDILKILPIYKDDIIRIVLTKQESKEQNIKFFKNKQNRLEAIIRSIDV